MGPIAIEPSLYTAKHKHMLTELKLWLTHKGEKRSRRNSVRPEV